MKTAVVDDATLARARRGDAAAFRRLYDLQVTFVFRFLRRFLGDDAAAQDALQDTFIRVHRGLAGFDPAGAASLSTWILTIARRVALTAATRNARPSPLMSTVGPIEARQDE